MKVQLGWLRVVVAFATAAGVAPAFAQYAPYRPVPQAQAGYSPAAAQPGTAAAGQPVSNPQPQQQPSTGVTGQTAYQPAQAYVAQATQPNTYAGYPVQSGAPQTYAQAYPQGYAQGYPTTYTAMAPQAGQPTPAQPSVPSGAVEVMPVPSGSAPSMSSGPATGMPAMQGMPMETMQGYPQAGQTAGGNCATPYPSTNGAGANCYGQDYGLSGYFDNDACGTQWFGGVYYLYMERDNASFSRVTVQADPGAYPYYPLERTTVLSTQNVDYDFNSGMEIRFGSSFTVGDGCSSGCNGYGNGYAGCNTGCGGGQLYAWEAAFWGLDSENQWFQVTDSDMTDTNRIYGMVNHAGLQYDDGGGNRPVNEYYDYQMPIVDDNPPAAGDYRVFSQRIRTNFRAHNAELNFLRIPVCNVGCSTCSSGCNSDSCGGYSGCSNGYSGGCETPSCGSGGPAFSMAALCGIRYFHIKDSFEMSTNDYTYNGGGWVDTAYGWDMFDDIQVENHLAGFQLGVNMNYCVACKWNLFADSTFGVYNNHMTKYQRVYGPTGYAEFIQEAREARVNSTKDDLSFLGEMRLGGSYDISCNWRAVLAYRAVAITGVGLASNQIGSEMSNWAEASRINSDGSIIIHGVQAGVECRY